MGIQPPGLQPLFLPTLQQIWLGWLGSQPRFRPPRSTRWTSRTGSEVSRNRCWSSRRSRSVFSTPFGATFGWRSVRNVSKIDENRAEQVYFSGIPKFSSKSRFQCFILSATGRFCFFRKENCSAPANTFLGTGTFLFSGSAAVAAGQSVRRPREGSGVGGRLGGAS